MLAILSAPLVTAVTPFSSFICVLLLDLAAFFFLFFWDCCCCCSFFCACSANSITTRYYATMNYQELLTNSYLSHFRSVEFTTRKTEILKHLFLSFYTTTFHEWKMTVLQSCSRKHKYGKWTVKFFILATGCLITWVRNLF